MTREEAIEQMLLMFEQDRWGGWACVFSHAEPGSPVDQALRLLKDTRHKAHASTCSGCGVREGELHLDGCATIMGTAKSTPIDENVNPDSFITPHHSLASALQHYMEAEGVSANVRVTPCPHCKGAGQVVSLYSTEPCPAGCPAPKAKGW